MWRTKKAPGLATQGSFCCFVWLDGADAASARALGARLDLEGHLLATAEAVEVKANSTRRACSRNGACGERRYCTGYLGVYPFRLVPNPWGFGQASRAGLIDLREVAFPQPQVLRSHLQELVVSEEVERLFEAQLAGRSQPHRDVRGGRPDVGLLLLPADIDPDVAWSLLDADDHPLVHCLAGLDEGGAALLRPGQPESQGGAGRRGGEGAVALLPEVACPGPVPDSDRAHQTGARGQRQEVVAEADQAAGRDQVFEAHAAPGVVADLDHLPAPLPERLRHRAQVLFADIDREPLHGLHTLAVDLLDDGLWTRDLELIALPAHRFDEHGQVKLAAPAHQESLGRIGVLHMEAEVGVQLLVEPGAQLPGGRKLALATRERRRVDTERHPNGRLVDLDTRQWVR